MTKKEFIKCIRCKVSLTPDNTIPASLARGRGYCRPCAAFHEADWRKRNPRREILRRIKNSARVRGLLFNLTIEDIPDIPQFCSVFPWIKLNYIVGSGYHGFDAPSVDRINNSLGYVKGNIRIISYRANALKSDATPEELIALGEDATHNKTNEAPIRKQPTKPSILSEGEPLTSSLIQEAYQDENRRRLDKPRKGKKASLIPYVPKLRSDMIKEIRAILSS